MNKLQLLADLKAELDALAYQTEGKLDALRRKSEMVIRNLYGPESKYLSDLSHISFYPMVYPSTPEYERHEWESGKEQMRNLFDTMATEIMIFEATMSPAAAAPNQDLNSQKGNPLTPQVFVVHGHDEAMKHAVARTLITLGLDPVILHEKPNRGRTIIEKFSDYADVSFPVVLLSPDDVARPRNSPPEEAKFRARQNVILELGYFLGTLGRDRVIALHQQAGDFEMPSDFSGVLFVPFDAAGRWQFDLARELKACGYPIDANRLM